MFSHYTYVDYKPGAQWTMYILRYNVQQPLLILDSDFVCVAVCCRALQCVAVCYSVLQGVAGRCRVLQGVAGCCSVLQGVAVCYSVLQGVAGRCRVLQGVAGCCRVLQCVAACCTGCCKISEYDIYIQHTGSILEQGVYVHPIAIGVSFNLNLHSQSHWSLFNGTWQQRPKQLNNRLRFEKEEMTLQKQ